MEKQNIELLRAYDNKLDQSTEEIVNTVKRTGANKKTCILPTKLKDIQFLDSTYR